LSSIELKLLGDFRVLRDGQELTLPPSRKTRALLAFLALHDRSFRREYLCELLWEVPDDPRGSLRWSLSKLRRLVDGPDRKRVVADRHSVALECADLSIDVNELFALAERGLESAGIAELEDAATRSQGDFLEGLELATFHDFHAWCVAERERTAQAQAAILKELTERLVDEPERALPYARALVAVSPYDEPARARLIRMLVSLRHADEAEQHFHLGLRMLSELGVTSSGALLAARRGTSEQADLHSASEKASEPRQVSTPTAPRAAPPAASPPRVPADLFGRDEEMARLTGAWSQVQQNHGAQFLLISGEPGMGKSSLLGALLEVGRTQGACILEARAYASEHYRPFGLWIDALRRLSPGAEEEIFGDRELDHRDRLLGRLSALVTREASERPVLLLFDDYQWSDESSAAALHYVARMNRDHAVLGVIAARSAELRDNAPAQQALRNLRADRLIEEMEIGPLSATDLKALIAARVPDADSDQLAYECRGNPLLAIELAHAGKSAGGSLDELVRERLAQFDTEGSEVLRWAAVLSPHIQLQDLVSMTGLATENVGAALERAVQQGMLIATGKAPNEKSKEKAEG
jgi:DNA-binding SARP family transcriptional activator